MQDIRGNVDTRLRKLREGGYDAVVLAEAGLRRLGLAGQISQRLPLEIVLPAVGQGAPGAGDTFGRRGYAGVRGQLDHPPSHAAVLAERALLATLQGGCTVPVAALGRVEGGQLTLIGRVVSLDGGKTARSPRNAPVAGLADARPSSGRIAVGPGCRPAACPLESVLRHELGPHRISGQLTEVERLRLN